MRIAPKGGRGRKQAKRKRGRGGEAKVRGKEKHPFSKTLERGEFPKKSLVLRKERFLFIRRKEINMAPPPKIKAIKTIGFPKSPGPQL